MRKHRETARRENEEMLKGIKRPGDISQINRNLQKNNSNYINFQHKNISNMPC